MADAYTRAISKVSARSLLDNLTMLPGVGDALSGLLGSYDFGKGVASDVSALNEKDPRNMIHKMAQNENYNSAAANLASVVPVLSAGMLRNNVVGKIFQNIEDASNGLKPKKIPIADIPEGLFKDINADRAATGKPLFDSNVIEYGGLHHADSRNAQGYDNTDRLMQVVSALKNSSVSNIDNKARVGLLSTSDRYDTYGNTVKDLAALQWNHGKPDIELMSVIPKGDEYIEGGKRVFNNPQAQMERAATSPQNTTLLGGGATPQEFRRTKVQPFNKYTTEQDVRQEIARINAVKMLGLPENNTAMDRAKALGYTSPVYHGTGSDVPYFDLSLSGQATDTGDFGRAVYTSPTTDIPNAYAAGKSPNILPLLAKVENPLTLQNWLNNPIKDFPYDKVYKDSDAVANAIKSKGYDSVIDLTDGVNETQIAHFDPTKLRSRFAAFDPARINEPDLLAGVGGVSLAGLLGLSMYDDKKRGLIGGI